MKTKKKSPKLYRLLILSAVFYAIMGIHVFFHVFVYDYLIKLKDPPYYFIALTVFEILVVTGAIISIYYARKLKRDWKSK